MTYLIAWTEYFDNTIAIRSYEAENPLEAARACWFGSMLPKDENTWPQTFINEAKIKGESFDSVEQIQNDFLDYNENISFPVALDEFLTIRHYCDIIIL